MTTTLTVPRRTRGKLARTLLATAAPLALGVLMTTSAVAYDVERAVVKEMSFTTQNVGTQWINVSASNRLGWDTIDPGNVSFGAHVMIDTRHYVFVHGTVRDVGIILGPCGEIACQGKPLLWAAHPMTPDYEHQTTVTFPTSKIPVSSSGGIATVPYGDDIIARCNNGTPGQEHTFEYLMQATFAADTFMQSGDHNNQSGTGQGPMSATWTHTTDHSLTKGFLVSVRCKGYEPSTSGAAVPPPPEPHRVKPVVAKDIDLFLTTVIPPPASQHGPSGTQCKPLKVTTRIETDKVGPVPVKLWRQVNGGPITSEQKQMTAEALAAGKFGDDWNKVEHFTQTTTVQYKAEILGGTFAPSTQWKSITIHCNGNFAPPTNGDPNNPPHNKPEAKLPLPPAIVTPPPMCDGKVMKVRGLEKCIKTAPVPDKRAEAAERKRKAALEAEKRRREAAQKAAEQKRQAMPAHRFGMRPNPAGPQRAVLGVGLNYRIR